MSSYLKNGDVAIDVGAYAGFYSVSMARAVGEEGRVYAFEAFPRYFRNLTRIIDSLGIQNIELFPVAISSSIGSVSVAYTDLNGRSLHGQVRITNSDESGSQTVKVDQTTLDHFAGEHPAVQEVQAVKIDIEGAELFALEGGAALLSSARPLIVCEIEERHCVRFGHKSQDVINAFRDLGYAPLVLEGGNTSVLVHWHPESSANNLIFVPLDRAKNIADRLLPNFVLDPPTRNGSRE